MAKLGKPLAGKVLVEPQAAETKTASGIIIPDTAQEKPSQGTIVAVGSSKDGEKMEVEVGNVVLYSKYGGTEINLDGKDYLIMNQTDILLIVE
jgi:chaperonin GroES